MIGLDTNVHARYYVDDDADAESARQHVAARRLIESGQPLMVCRSVTLELQWIMRGYYGFGPLQVASVLRHLLDQVAETPKPRADGRSIVELCTHEPRPRLRKHLGRFCQTR